MASSKAFTWLILFSDSVYLEKSVPYCLRVYSKFRCLQHACVGIGVGVVECVHTDL